MIAATARQAQVLIFIRRHIREHGYPPGLRDIGRHFEIGSTNGVRDHLIALAKKGLIDFAAGKARGIKLTSGSCPMCSGSGHLGAA